MVELTVVIPTHNPNRARLERTLLGLRAQTLAPDRWNCVLVDNASSPPLEDVNWKAVAPKSFATIREPMLGLSAARRAGFAATTADIVVLADDDNVLATDYLANVHRIFSVHSGVGIIGGKSLPEFEAEPAVWAREFFPLLALRDLGDEPHIARGLRPSDSHPAEYPLFAPIGAGMALRRAAAETWLQRASALSDRRGTELTSAGDNEIVLCALQSGWEVGYFPELVLTHLIPSTRLDPAYLGRLNRGIQKSWMQVLSRYNANSWPALTQFGAWLRQIKAWFSYRAWQSPAARIRWQGACGHFAGRVS